MLLLRESKNCRSVLTPPVSEWADS